MTPILPWLPATKLVFGMDIRLCRHVAEKTVEKTLAAADKISTGERPKEWGPLNIVFEIDGQKIEFTSTAYVSTSETRITVENQLAFIEGNKNVVFTFAETMEVIFPNKKGRADGEKPKTYAGINAVITTDLPASLAATLPGKTMNKLVDLPGDFNAAIGDLVIREINGRIIMLDASAYTQQADQIHQNFQATLKD